MFWSSLAPKWPIVFPFCGQDHQKSNFWLISDTLSASLCYFFKNWLMKLKISNLRMSEPPSNKFYFPYFYLSESMEKACFNMRHPVFEKKGFPYDNLGGKLVAPWTPMYFGSLGYHDSSLLLFSYLLKLINAPFVVIPNYLFLLLFIFYQ